MKEAALAMFAVIIYVCILAVLDLALAFPLMLCWNHAVTPVLGLPLISWSQAFCLLIVCGLLIKASSGTKASDD